MRAIILSAGIGSRLGEMTRNMTKGMVSVGGKKLIDYLFDFLDLDYFQEILIVGGYFFRDLKRYIDSKDIERVRVIENEKYLKGNIFSLIRGLEEFAGDSFLITNVDHIYPSVMFDKMRESFEFITAMCDFDRVLGDDDMKVKLRDDRKCIEHIDKKLSDYDCGYIGMSYVDVSMEGIYRDAVEETLDRFGEKAVVENILQLLAQDEATAPRICDLTGIGWFEVDTEEDLFRAEKEILRNEKFR
jgi:choline kinase